MLKQAYYTQSPLKKKKGITLALKKKNIVCRVPEWLSWLVEHCPFLCSLIPSAGSPLPFENI